MFNLDKFISDSVTKRLVSMFAADIEANKVLGAANVAWLNTDYGFVVKKPEELASML